MTQELAINGGKPVRDKLLPYGHQWIDEEDIAAVIEVLRSDWITQGSKVVEFEKEFAGYVGAKYAVAVNSGTAALHAACFAAQIEKGDEVVTTPNFCGFCKLRALSGGNSSICRYRCGYSKYRSHRD